MTLLKPIFGAFIFIFIAFLFSENKRGINWKRTGFLLVAHFLLAIILLKLPLGIVLLKKITEVVNAVLGSVNSGINFVFGPIAKDFSFAINVLSVIIFLSALMALLEKIKVLPFIIKGIGGPISRAFKLGKIESFTAVSSIFLGLSDAFFCVRPYLSSLNRSQVFALTTSAFASVAGTVMVGLASMGVDVGMLILASSMTVFSSFVFAKIIIPDNNTEVDNSEINLSSFEGNIFEVLSKGVQAGLKVAAIVGATVLVFMGLITLMNTIIIHISGIFGLNISFEDILGWIFYPVAYLLGINSNDIMSVSSIIAKKTFFNEFVAFIKMNDLNLSEHSRIVTTIALCGFTNLGSIGIIIAGVSSIAPALSKTVNEIILKALLAGLLANIFNATIISIILLS